MAAWLDLAWEDCPGLDLEWGDVDSDMSSTLGPDLEWEDADSDTWSTTADNGHVDDPSDIWPKATRWTPPTSDARSTTADGGLPSDLWTKATGWTGPWSPGYPGDQRDRVLESRVPLCCSCCKMWLNGPEQWKGHLIGKKHKRNAKGMQGREALPLILEEDLPPEQDQHHFPEYMVISDAHGNGSQEFPEWVMWQPSRNRELPLLAAQGPGV